MRYILAKSAGFCFGVNRAVDIVNKLLDSGDKVATLGPIIHNPQMVADLSKRGARIIETEQEAQADETVVIRSHGVPKSTVDYFIEKKQKYCDVTCPFVSKIHKIVFDNSLDGKEVIIAGDKNHPEVQGIIGHCVTKSYVVANENDLLNLYYKLTDFQKNNLIIVAQTTFNKEIWNNCTEIAKKHYTKAKIFDTICSATSERQNEAACLSKQCDLMIVIGGKQSSNTHKLSDVCSKNCKTILIETADDLQSVDLTFFNIIGVTAGASTPAYIIKEVLRTMSETMQNEDFAALLEQSLESQKIYNGKRVNGIVTSVLANEVHVDIGAKQAGIIPASEFSDDPSLKLEEAVKKGDELNLCVVKVNDQEGIVTLSKKRCDALAGFEKLKEAFEKDETLDGVVTDVVRGGILVYTLGTKVFVPASLANDQRVEDFNTMLHKDVRLKIIDINEQRGRAKGSIRAVLNALRKEKAEKIWDGIEVGNTYTGEVKSLTAYGAFVDIGGVDGMIHITELSWNKIKNPAEVVSVGDTVEVYVKDIDKEKKRISLGYKKSEDNPMVIFNSKYKVGDVADVKIVSFTTYGAFAEIITGVDGLIHISQIADKHVEKISDVLKAGETVQAKIIEIDEAKKRISLSIRALSETTDEENNENSAEEVTE